MVIILLIQDSDNERFEKCLKEIKEHVTLNVMILILWIKIKKGIYYILNKINKFINVNKYHPLSINRQF
jgi:hypothetical protein